MLVEDKTISLLQFHKSIISENYKVDRLREGFGKNKLYPKAFELPILIALSYFPELKDVKIHFLEKKSELAFSSRPLISSLFKNISAREYVIILSTKSHKVPNHLLFDSLPINAQVGILGHELSHTVYYLNKNFLELILIGVKYLIPTYRIPFEKNTDKETINRGLGYQLLDFANYCRQSNSPHKLVKWLDTYYLSPQDILSSIKQNKNYT